MTEARFVCRKSCRNHRSWMRARMSLKDKGWWSWYSLSLSTTRLFVFFSIPQHMGTYSVLSSSCCTPPDSFEYDDLFWWQSFEEASSPLQDSDMDIHEVDELTLRFSLGDVKAALGEIRERLDDIRCGEVHYRHSGETLPCEKCNDTALLAFHSI